jgi:HAE1 family hydrophobic/amphiphilic exporter-1
MSVRTLLNPTAVAKIEQTNESNTILHKSGQQYLRVTALVDSTKLSDVSKMIKTETDALKLPVGVTLIQGGASAQQNSDFADLFLTMLVSIGIVFLIMVITFKAFRAPIASIFSLPFAAVGAIVGMMITGTSFDVTSIFGFLMLIGIVVTNAIVVIGGLSVATVFTLIMVPTIYETLHFIKARRQRKQEAAASKTIAA